MAGMGVVMKAEMEISTVPQVEESHFHNISPGRLLLRKAVATVVACVLLYSSYTVLADRVGAQFGNPSFPGIHTPGDCSSPSPKVPQYFQTSPALWAGPTATGRAP